MKQACSKLPALLFALALAVPGMVMAQKEEKVRDKEKKEAEQIIITRKGDTEGKVIVEIDGDRVKVNGKPVDEDKDGDVSVRRHRIRDVWAYADGLKGGVGRAPEAFRMFSMDSNKAMLGVTTEKVEKGVEVKNITGESAASKAGLKEGDIIIRVDETKVETPDQLSEVIQKRKPGDKITVAFLRDGKEQKVTAELGKWKGPNIFSVSPGQNFNFNFDELDLSDLMPRAPMAPRPPSVRQGQNWNWAGGAPRLGLSVQDTEDGKGVKIIEVDEEGNAAKAGLKEDDIITEVDGKAVNGADEMAKMIRESRNKSSVLLKLTRAKKTMNVEVKIPRKLKTADL